MSNALVDFSFVYEQSDNDRDYVHEITNIYLKVVSEGLDKLKDLVGSAEELEDVRRQAHYLKSSANTIKIKGMYDELVATEHMARDGADRKGLHVQADKLISMFEAARPELEAEIEKTKP